MNKCPCGAGPNDGPAPAWLAEWHRWHMRRHMEQFPDVDQRTVDNLRQCIAVAEARERK